MSLLVYSKKTSYLTNDLKTVEIGSTIFNPEEEKIYFMPEIGQMSSITSEALLNNVEYKSFVEAVAMASGDAVIKLLGDVVLDEPLTIPVGANIVLDLNNKTISADEKVSYNGGLITVPHGSSLVINGEGNVIAHEKIYSPFQMTSKKFMNDKEPASLTINGGHYCGYYYVICGNGLKGRGNSEVIINDGIFETTAENDGSVIFNPQENSSVTITGGEFIGKGTGIEMRSGNLIIEGGHIKTSAAPATISPNGNGTTAVGSAIAICQHTTKKDLGVTIDGGIFEGYHALYQANPQKNDDEAISRVKMTVNGGKFIAINGGEMPVYSENKEHFIHGGTFDPAIDEKYMA